MLDDVPAGRHTNLPMIQLMEGLAPVKRSFTEDSEGRLHSENPTTPAVTHDDGYKAWYKHGQLHNPAGPAVIHASGDKEFWLHACHMTEADFNALQSSGADLENPECVSNIRKFQAPSRKGHSREL